MTAGCSLWFQGSAASHAGPRTMMRYDRARDSPGRHATSIAAACLASAAP
jgi:hypothetical protein